MKYFVNKQPEKYISGEKYIWTESGPCSTCIFDDISSCKFNKNIMKDFVCMIENRFHPYHDNIILDGNFQIEKYK